MSVDGVVSRGLGPQTLEGHLGSLVLVLESAFEVSAADHRYRLEGAWAQTTALAHDGKHADRPSELGPAEGRGVARCPLRRSSIGGWETQPACQCVVVFGGRPA